MLIRPEQENPSLVYSTMIRAITPRPIAWVSTTSEKGVQNLAPFSYFNGVCSRPAAISFSPVNRSDGSKKDTIVNIENTGEFVVNVVSLEMSEAMLKTATELDFEENEFEFAGIQSCESKVVAAPGVLKSPIRFECKLLQIVPVGEGPLAANLVIGEVLLIDIDDSVVDERGRIDPSRVDAVGRMGGREYCRTNNRFSINPSN